jgi:hypothetical protein
MSTATDILAAYQSAELAVLKGLSYRIGDLMLTRSNLNEIIAGRKEWQRRVNDELRAAAEGGAQVLSQVGVDLSFGTQRGLIEGCDGWSPL